VCIFCDIIAGTADAHVVFSDDQHIAFLDRRPVFPGHTLVVPRSHLVTLDEVPATDVGPLFTTVQKLAMAVETALDAHGTFVALNNKVSQSVPHLHVHVVPRRFKDGLRGFFWPRQKYSGEEEMAAVAASIDAALGAAP
jgi:histidine triad (HIT) family protein